MIIVGVFAHSYRIRIGKLGGLQVGGGGWVLVVGFVSDVEDRGGGGGGVWVEERWRRSGAGMVDWRRKQRSEQCSKCYCA